MCTQDWEFPGGPVVRTQGHGFNPWLGNKDPTCCATWTKKTKKQKKEKKCAYRTYEGRRLILNMAHVSHRNYLHAK